MLTESVADYLGTLRKLAPDCSFGGFLTSALRDAFVIGLYDRRMQAKLLTMANLTLDVILQAQSIQDPKLGKDEPVHMVKKNPVWSVWRTRLQGYRLSYQ